MYRLRTTLILLVLVAMIPTANFASPSDNSAGELVETFEVKRADERNTKYSSLRYLQDNRVFLRARLDLLRLQITITRDGSVTVLDERFLRLQELAAAIAAARDTVRTEHERTASRTLLTSVTQLGELEAELNLMEQLLDEQRARLVIVEQDFLGNQETALVILIKGLAGKDVPASMLVTEGNEISRIEFTDAQQLSLSQGGIAQIYHRFVEPREHVLTVAFKGISWTELPSVRINVDAPRDRLTFLEIDLSQLDRKRESLGLLTSVWHR